MVEGHVERGDSESSFFARLIGGILSLYFVTVPFAEIYFAWQFAKREGFFAWICFGGIVPALKALVWPYFAMHSDGAARDVPFPEMLLNLVDWITSIATIALGFIVLSLLLALIGMFAQKFRFGKAMFAFCVALGSSYSASFALTIIALAIHGPMPPKNAVLPAFTWLLFAAMCLWQALFFGPEESSAPAIWAYAINGMISILPVLIADDTFVVLFTALPLFGVAILLRLQMSYRDRGTAGLAVDAGTIKSG